MHVVNRKIRNWPVSLTKQADIHLLQRVDAAELVELVVNLVEDQSFVVVCGEVPHYVVHCGKKREFKPKENRRDRRAASDMSVGAAGTPDVRRSEPGG